MKAVSDEGSEQAVNNQEGRYKEVRKMGRRRFKLVPDHGVELMEMEGESLQIAVQLIVPRAVELER